MVDNVSQRLRIIDHKRILIFAPSAYPLGGIANWLDYLSPGLEEEGWQVIHGLVTGQHHDSDAYLQRHPWPQALRITNKTGSREGRIIAICEVLKKVRPDIVLVVNQVTAYEAIRRMRCKNEHVPKVVMALHALQSNLLKDIARQRDILDAVIATNQLACRLAQNTLGSPSRVFYAPYGVIPWLGKRSRNDIPSDVIRLLYAGRIEEKQKRIIDLIQVMGTLKRQNVGATLTIAGGGTAAKHLQSKFEELGLSNDVNFCGILSFDQLALAYKTHDALIITSEWETGPIVAWEAMSYGLPVVSSRYIGSGAESALVDGENCFLFDIGDIEGAVRAIARVRNQVLRECITDGGIRTVRKRYSRDKSIQQWVNAIRMVRELPPLQPPRYRSTSITSGRLDRWLGQKWGERVRRTIRIQHAHSDAGGEWPHSEHDASDQATFLKQVSELDIAQ